MSFSNIVHGIKTRITMAKPYIVGAVIGAVATVIIEFNAGWVVTVGTHKQELAQASVSAMATVCAQQAGVHWTTEGNEMSALDGWSNDERDALAERFTPQLNDVKTDAITRLCGRMLRQA